MTDYKKLVKALRYCGNFTEREGCAESCEYFNDMDCPNRIMSDAAAAIEALQAEQKKTVTQIFGEEQQEWEEYCTGLMNRYVWVDNTGEIVRQRV